jgi:hypothetical protein
MKRKNTIVYVFYVGLPCIMNYVYTNQLDTLFVLSLLN